jgi:hypothetical protein
MALAAPASPRRRHSWVTLSVAEQDFEQAWNVCHEACQSAGAETGCRSCPHRIAPPRSIPTSRRVFEFKCSCANITGCPALYRIIETSPSSPTSASQFEVQCALEHSHVGVISRQIPHAVVQRIEVLVRDCGVSKARHLRRFLHAEGLLDEEIGNERLRRHIRLHRSRLLDAGFSSTCAGLQALSTHHSLQSAIMERVSSPSSAVWDPDLLHLSGCLSGPEAISEGSGRVWLSFSSVHYAFNYVRSMIAGMRFVNSDSTESVNWNRYPLLAGGTVDFAQHDQLIVLAVSSTRTASDFAQLWTDVLDWLAWYLCFHCHCIQTDVDHPLHHCTGGLRSVLGATWAQGSPDPLARYYIRRRLGGEVLYSMSDAAVEIQHGAHQVFSHVTSLNCNAHHAVKGYSVSGGLRKSIVVNDTESETGTVGERRARIARTMRWDMLQIGRISHQFVWAVSIALDIHYAEWSENQPAYVRHHRHEYGPQAQQWQMRWSRAYSAAGVPNHNNGRESGFARFKAEVVDVGIPCPLSQMIQNSLSWVAEKSRDRSVTAPWTSIPCMESTAAQAELWRQALNLVREDGLHADIFVCSFGEGHSLVIPSRATIDRATEAAQRRKVRILRLRGLRVPHIGSILVSTNDLTRALQPMYHSWRALTESATSCHAAISSDSRGRNPRLQSVSGLTRALDAFHHLKRLPASSWRGAVRWSCTCSLYGERGICPHILAAELQEDSSTVDRAYTNTYLPEDISHRSLHQRRSPGRPAHDRHLPNMNVSGAHRWYG